MKRIKQQDYLNQLKEDKPSAIKIILDDRLFSFASILAAAYEMQGAGYFYFETGEKHKIIVNFITLDKKSNEQTDQPKMIVKEFKNQVIRFLRYELNISKRIKGRLLNYYQSYFAFEYKECPDMLFSQKFGDLIKGNGPIEDYNEPISQTIDKTNLNPRYENNNSNGIKAEKPEKSIIKEEDFSEIKSTDKLEDVVVDDEEGISTPWEIKYGSTENE